MAPGVLDRRRRETEGRTGHAATQYAEDSLQQQQLGRVYSWQLAMRRFSSCEVVTAHLVLDIRVQLAMESVAATPSVPVFRPQS
jgi:hypothetical protein